ncbi:hypothetical protein RUM44_001059 [Polyplax serrata]|uniref:cardiolipin synthase (CMP-forming) n=1 Tax=Polyplax serrata TaxID=468196 RepID=A0ABR1BA62_POLSC
MPQLLKMLLKMECIGGGNLLGTRHRNTLSVNLMNYTRITYLCNLCCIDKRAGILTCPGNNPISIIRTYSKRDKDSSESQAIVFNKSLGQRKSSKKRMQDAVENKQRNLQRDIENVLEERRMALKNARRRMQERGKIIIQDIKETKNKMKEKFEGVIERENVYTIPNLICLARIGLSPLLGYLIVSEKFEYALTFMVVAGLSDWIDGWVARNYKSQCSKIGSFLDPMADKVLIATLFLSLTYVYLIPVALTTLVIFRDVVLIISGFVIRYRSLPPPRTLSRYFDVTHATAQLAPTFISKVNTGVQLVLVGTTLAAPVFGYVNHSFLHFMWYVTAASTIAAAGSYIFSKKTYRYLQNKNCRKK